MYTRFYAKACIALAAGLFFMACQDDPEPKPTSSFKVEVLVYDESSNDFELTTATLTVTTQSHTGQEVITKELSAETSTIELPEKEIYVYTVEISKTGYISYYSPFSPEKLEQFNNSPLVVKLILESINNGLTAFFPFKGNANDSTRNLYLGGTVYGATLTTGRKGFDACYYFDGVDDYIKVPNQTQLNTSGDFAISVWTAVSSTQIGTEGINDIIRKWNGDTEGYPYSISYLNTNADDANEDKFIYARYDGSACTNTPTSYSPLVTNDEFSHIVLVKQGTTLKHYLNGTLIQEFTDNTSCGTSNTADLTIGCRGNLVRYFKGKIDDIRIYSRSVSEAEVASLYIE